MISTPLNAQFIEFNDSKLLTNSGTIKMQSELKSKRTCVGSIETGKL